MLLTAMIAATIPTGASINVTPGAEFSITENTSNLQDQDSDLNIEFNQQDSTLFGQTPEGFPSETGEITLTYQNNSNLSDTFSQTINVTVNEYSNWSIQRREIPENILMNSDGQLTILNITQKGNVQKTVNVEASGNLTKFLSFADGFEVYPQNTVRQTISYSFPSSMESGVYNASFNFSEENGNISRMLNLSTTIKDEIPPTVEGVSFPDVMSTQAVNFTANISDNQEVDNVEAEILKEVTVEEGEDGTDTINQSFDRVNFNPSDSTYGKTFIQTEEIGQYYYRLFVNDTAGNTVEKRGEFEIKGLEAVEILNGNFEFDTVYPKDASGNVIENKQSKARKNIFRIDEDTTLDVKLENFQHTDPNSTVSIGILTPQEDVPQNFDLDEENPSMTFSERGEYGLVVESSKSESFSGELNLTLAPQHVGDRYRKIVYEGLISNPEYPPEQDWSVKGFNATLDYLDRDGSGQPDQLRRVLTAPAEVCKGFSSAEECPQINEFDKIVQEVKDENNRLENKNSFLAFQRNVSVILTVVILFAYIRSKNLSGRHVAVTPVKQ